MALHNFARPPLPYVNEPRPNDNRFAVLTNGIKPVPVFMLEGEHNFFIDSLNKLDVDINNISAGIVPGSNISTNAGLFITTDGAAQPTLSFVRPSGDSFLDATIPGVKIVDQSITMQQIGNASVGTDQLQDSSVSVSKILERTITATKIAFGTITSTEIASSTITNREIAPFTIKATSIANKAITAAQIADNTIAALQIVNKAITAAQIADKAITAAQIADNTITALQIVNKAITAAQIADNTITFGQISNSFAATKSQQQAASSSSVFVSPAKQQDHPSACKVWVTFDGSTGAIQAGYNVSSVTVLSPSTYKINFSTNLATRYYATIITSQSTGSIIPRVDSIVPPTVSGVNISLNIIPDYVNVAIFGG